MQAQKVIEHLGYSASEAKVYLATLALGEAHISDIAAKAKLPRTSAQALVDKLHKDGLLNFYVERRYKYWVAENPERLLARIQRREDTLRGMLPALDTLRRQALRRGSTRSARTHDIGFFRILADGSNQPILVTNSESGIEYVNSAWERQFGYALEEVRGKDPRILQSGLTKAAEYERLWKALEKGALFQSSEIIDKRKDGTHVAVLTTIFAVEHNGARYYVQILESTDGSNGRADVLRKRFLNAAAA